MATIYTGTPPSILTRPADVNTYAQNDLIASSVTAGSVVVPPAKTLSQMAGTFLFRRFRLYTNITTGWDATTFSIRLWSIAPTYTNGDNGAYAVATGAANYLGKVTLTLNQFADGAAGVGTSADGVDIQIFMPSGGSFFWDLQYTGTGALTPISAQTFTLICESVLL